MLLYGRTYLFLRNLFQKKEIPLARKRFVLNWFIIYIYMSAYSFRIVLLLIFLINFEYRIEF